MKLGEEKGKKAVWVGFSFSKMWISKCSGEGEARLAWDGERVFPCPGTGKEWDLGGPEHPALPQRWRGAVWLVIAVLCSLSKGGRSYKSGFWKVLSHSSWHLLSSKVGIWAARALHALQNFARAAVSYSSQRLMSVLPSAFLWGIFSLLCGFCSVFHFTSSSGLLQSVCEAPHWHCCKSVQ